MIRLLLTGFLAAACSFNSIGQPAAMGAAQLDELFNKIEALATEDPTQALMEGRNALRYSRHLKDSFRIAKSTLMIGTVHYYMGRYDSASSYFHLAEAIYPATGPPAYQAIVLNNIGLLEKRLGRLDSAQYYLMEALRIRKAVGSPNEIAASHLNISNVLHQIGADEDALTHLEKAGLLFKDNGHLKGEAGVWMNTGNILREQGKRNAARTSYLEALRLYAALGDHRRKANALNNVGLIYQEEGDHERAIGHFEKALVLKRKHQDPVSAASTMLNLAGSQHSLNGDNILPLLDEAWDIATNSGDISLQKRIADAYVSHHTSLESFEEALHWQGISTHFSDSIFRKEAKATIADLELRFKMETQAEDIALLKEINRRKDAEMREAILAGRNSNLQRNMWIAFAIILAVLLVMLRIGYRKVVGAKDALKSKRKALQKRQKEIADSMGYASKIQGSLLPATENWNAHFEAHFVFYKPREAIGGDFYWSDQIGDHLFIAVADCTGHGIPGAMMSFLGHAYLQQAVRVRNLRSPAAILDYLSEEVNNILQSGKERKQKDGMDMAFLALDVTSGHLEFAGAGRPFMLLRSAEHVANPVDHLGANTFRKATRKNEVCYEIKGKRQPVGAFPAARRKPFENIDFQLEKGDRLYLFSDGYADQFNSYGRKFLSKNFRELILRVQGLSMDAQLQRLDHQLREWQGKARQTDDICVVGLKY